MAEALFFRPQYELATNYLHDWFGLGVIEARRLGYEVVDLSGPEATLENLLDVLRSNEFSVLFMGGHGNPNTFTGQNSSIVLRACQNDEIMSGSLSYFLSCFVGQELLPSMISKSALSCVGFQTDFRFMVDTSYPILEDPLAEPFMATVFDHHSRILRGETIKQVWEGGIRTFDQWIAKLYPRPETIWSQVIGCLEHDRDGMIALGQQEAYAKRPAAVTWTPISTMVAPIVFGTLLALIA